MTSIIKATVDDAGLLSEIAKISFIESHGTSAAKEDIDSYVNTHYSYDEFTKELRDAKNIYYIIYHDDNPAGYTKIILNASYHGSPAKNLTKLERIYLVKEFYHLKLGVELLKFNIDLSKANGQSGMWLFVWTENQRAVNFYKKNGFIIIGSHDFPISKTHANPNHQMLLTY